jgi:hypothetical protein
MTQVLSIAAILFLDWLVFKFMFMPVYLQYQKIRQIARSMPIVKGNVVDHVMKLDIDQHEQFAPVVRFTAHTGKEYVVESDDFRLRKKKIGSLVDVSYEADNPSNAVVEPESQMGFKLVILGLILVVMTIVTVAVIYKYTK